MLILFKIYLKFNEYQLNNINKTISTQNNENFMDTSNNNINVHPNSNQSQKILLSKKLSFFFFMSIIRTKMDDEYKNHFDHFIGNHMAIMVTVG
jgi:hypothetical protein